ncbi:MAG TPA: hypothetical protein VFT56_09150 [Sphingomonas sp.]|nr:hypothetical protein [Sphingomonas sp.]
MAASAPDCQGAAAGISDLGMAESDDKAARLAAKLRENLRKRKAQAREQTAPPHPEPARDKDETAS